MHKKVCRFLEKVLDKMVIFTYNLKGFRRAAQQGFEKMK